MMGDDLGVDSTSDTSHGNTIARGEGSTTDWLQPDVGLQKSCIKLNSGTSRSRKLRSCYQMMLALSKIYTFAKFPCHDVTNTIAELSN